jgi:predicted O-methyltransferase YrrM
MKLHESRANLIIEHLNQLKQIYGDVVVVETGSIRNVKPEYIVGDGHSTHLIAQWIKANGGNFFSIDLDTSVAKKYLTELNLINWVQLIQMNSVNFLNKLKQDGVKLNLAYLDSANDPDLILAEFKIVESMMTPEGIIIIDDCIPDHPELLKGNAAIPYAKSQGYKVNLKARQGVIFV